MLTDYRARIYGQYVERHPDHIAPDDIEGLNARAPQIRKWTRKLFPDNRDAAIIDLGCGHGALIHIIRQMGYSNVRGIDRSPEQVATARRLGIEGVEEGDLMEALAKLPASSQDVVITFDVLEHFLKPELLPFIDAVHFVLKPGGLWLIHVPNGEALFGSRMRYADFTHELAFTRVSIAHLLIASGFARVSCYEDAPVPHGFFSAVRWLLWWIIKAMLHGYMAVEVGNFQRDALFTQNLYAAAWK